MTQKKTIEEQSIGIQYQLGAYVMKDQNDFNSFNKTKFYSQSTVKEISKNKGWPKS